MVEEARRQGTTRRAAFRDITDKVDAEIPAPASGVLKEIKIAEGTTVGVNTVVGTIAVDGEGGRSCQAVSPRTSRRKACRRQG